MTPLWMCPTCFVLNDASACRTCGRGRAEPPPEPPPVAPRTILRMPRRDFPYTRTHRTRNVNRSLLGPALLVVAATLIAVGFEPVTTQIAFANVPGVTLEHRQRVRQAELQRATRALRELGDELRRAARPGGPELPSRWADRVESVESRYRLHGERGLTTPFADEEVSLRAVALELASLHHRYVAGALADDALPRLDAAELELARVMEELTHAR